MKALIIEPSGFYQKLLQEVFRGAGFECAITATGRVGLQQDLIDTYDLVCVALHLPDMNGIEFCTSLRKQEGARHMPVILFTSEESSAYLAESRASGITEVFGKSSIDELSDYLSEMAQKGDTQSGYYARCLLIEDNLSIALVLKDMLTRHGFGVEHRASAEDALALFAEESFDVVLSDVVLEGKMSGLGFVRAVRRMEGARNRVPILAMSALDDNTRKIELLRAGANDFVSKPVQEEELVARTRNLASNKMLFDQVESQQQRMRELAMTDALTGLYNRHSLAEMAPKYISESRRHKYPLSLLIVDVDHFKLVNDNHGHAIGDIVLSEIGALLMGNTRDEDFAARFGGEEFVLLLTHCDSDSASIKAEHLRSTIAQAKPADVQVTASFGVAELGQDGAWDFESLFAIADKAVYRAKESGRNCVVMADAA